MHDNRMPRRTLALGPGRAVIACDVGGTTMKTALVSSAGEVGAVRRTATPRGPGAPGEIIQRLRAELHELGAGSTIGAVGLSVPGLVDDARGIGMASSNLGWSNVPFRALAAEALDLPIAFGHDVRAAAHAEFEVGAARGTTNAAVVVVGTGVSCALRLDGHDIIAGGFAGEIGHSIVTSETIMCPCGELGHLEGIASAEAIARRFMTRTGIDVDGSRGVLALANDGNPEAQRVWDEAVVALARGLAQLVSIAAPEVIVVGGGLAEAGNALFGPLRDQLTRLLSVHRRPEVRAAALGDDAGLIGTALAARALAH